MIRYCPNCDDERELREDWRRQFVVVKGEEIEFDAPVSVCRVCGEVVFDPDRDDAVLRRAYDLYRQRHGLLTSDEIVKLRERYGLSQRALARLLRWGLVTIQRYEKGVIQDRAHDEVLRSLYDPRRLLTVLDKGDNGLSDDEREALRRKAQEILEEERSVWLFRDVGSLLRARQPDVYNGFRAFDPNRFVGVVRWFAERVKHLPKTKLAKLLWLADFKHFREHGVSITGASYARLPFGPVPDGYELLLGLAVASGAVVVVEELFGEYVGEAVRPRVTCYESPLEEHEMATLRYVVGKFGHYSAKKLSELSHEEQAWRERVDGELMPYDDAKRLRILN
jgi:putative zinc finger/helix-turn-helix protein, YgiT family